VNALEPGAEGGDVEKEDIDGGGKEEKGAELPVTQSDDPRSGGHLLLGASKAPLSRQRVRSWCEWQKERNIPRVPQRT